MRVDPLHCGLERGEGLDGDREGEVFGGVVGIGGGEDLGRRRENGGGGLESGERGLVAEQLDVRSEEGFGNLGPDGAQHLFVDDERLGGVTRRRIICL